MTVRLGLIVPAETMKVRQASMVAEVGLGWAD